MKRDKIRTLTYISLCVAILAVISQLAIPIGPVPLTLQIFVVSLMGYFLKAKNGTVAILVYILLGAVGVPVFASLQGGLGILISYTGGFIFGYIPLVLLCGIGKSRWQKILLGVCGLLLCHTAGVLQYMLLSHLSIWASFVAVSLPFILKDVALVVCALVVSDIMEKRIKK